jgi:hypothetical protein
MEIPLNLSPAIMLGSKTEELALLQTKNRVNYQIFLGFTELTNP